MEAGGRLGAVLKGVACAGVGCELLGALAGNGEGHATYKAVILGLAGFLPDGIEPELIDSLVDQVRAHHRLRVADRDIAFNPKEDLRFDRMGETPVHPNTLRFAAYDSNDEEVIVQRDRKSTRLN